VVAIILASSDSALSSSVMICWNIVATGVNMFRSLNWLTWYLLVVPQGREAFISPTEGGWGCCCCCVLLRSTAATDSPGHLNVKVKVRVTLLLAVYRQSIRLGVNPFETHYQRSFFFHLIPCGNIPYIISSLTRRPFFQRTCQTYSMLLNIFPFALLAVCPGYIVSTRTA
jgi:hypothetical protein